MLAMPAALAAVITALGAGTAQAEPRVPCSPGALSSALAGAAPGATLTLAAGCRYVLSAPLPAITADLTIAGSHATLERPGSVPPFSILTVTGGALTVNGLNFTGGGGSPSLGGGAIDDTGNGQLTVTAGQFTGNTAGYGGAISDAAPDGQVAPDITGAVFTGNSAASDGGALASGATSASVSCDNCTFRRNTAQNGGAADDYGNGNGGFSNSTFTGNTASNAGGALYLYELTRLGLGDDTIRGNTAYTGGGIYVQGDSNAMDGFPYGGEGVGVSGGIIAGNHATAEGGGIYSDAVASVTGTVIKSNTALDGAGVYTELATLITSARITGNRATADGGGTAGGPESTTVLTDTPVTGNRAVSGGGIWNGADFSPDVELDGTTSVTGNRPNNCAPPGSVRGCTG
jgi:predicted outer membrane repeat protein